MSQAAVGLSGRLALGRYRVIRELARGGMGMVYLGRIEGAAGFSKPVVIKRVLSHVDENKGAREQFIREARLLSELHHPNIVGVLDFGEEDDGYLMILEYVHGFHIGQWLKYALSRGERLHWEFALLVVSRVLSALHYAHNRIGPDGKKNAIIHRDVSPGNVLIDLQGNVRLLDFGIARATDDEEAKTQNGIVKGKLPYIAPEIYRSASASPESDVYSTGVMLYQLLSGHNPFSAKDMSAIIGRVLEHVPPPISTLRDDLPPGIDSVVARALVKDPRKRFQSAQEFASALMSLLSCSEAELVDQMRAAVAIEFSDEMAHVLGVPSLTELDAAWRASADDPDGVDSLQRSSLPPADDTHTAVTAEMPLRGAPAGTMHDVETLVAPITAKFHAEKMRGESPPGQMASAGFSPRNAARDETSMRAELFNDSGTRTITSPHVEPTTGSHDSSRSMVAILIGAGLVAAAVLGGAFLLRGEKIDTSDKPQRFLVVERPSVKPTPSIPTQPAAATGGEVREQTASPPADPPPTERIPSDGKRAPVATGHKSPAPTSDAERVTAAFGRRQSAVQSCFSQAASGVSGTPQISLRFKIDGAGSVQSTSLSPGSVSGTALGSCLLNVARSTQFPALGKSLNFSIPITAQVINK